MSNLNLQISWGPAKAQRNEKKHRVTFAEAATVLLDPLALTVLDAGHSEDEERWFTLGRASAGEASGSSRIPIDWRMRMRCRHVSSFRRARQQAANVVSDEQNPEYEIVMNTLQNDEMPDEIDFSQGTRGRFYRPNATLGLPICLDEAVQARLAHLASAKGLELSELVNDLLRKDIDLIENAL